MISRSLTIATAGHVDHGKTSLVRHLTGTNTDTLAEEKSRGLTINLGYAYYHFQSSTDGTDYDNTLGFVDVPGHTDFINNMLAGVGAVDAALLVVAADDGIMPQTREHLAILDLLGISHGLVALTKIDRVSAERSAAVSAEIRQLLQTTTLRDAPIFPLSNKSKDGIADLLQHLQSLFNRPAADAGHIKSQYFRYLIDRSFSVKGIGTVVTGSVRAGAAAVGASLLHTGTNELTKLRGLRQDATELGEVRAHQRVAANINRSHTEIKRGDWLVDPQLYAPALRLDTALRFIDENFSLRSNAQYHLYIGACHRIVTLRQLGSPADGFFQIKSNTAIIAHYGDRFVVRDPASQQTIGGGQVIDIFVPRRQRSSAQRIATLTALQQDSYAALCALLELQPAGVDLDQFALCRNLSPAGIDSLYQQLQAASVPYLCLSVAGKTFPILLHDRHYQQHARQILQHLEKYHQAHVNQQGISEPALSKELEFSGSHLLFHGLLQELLRTDAIKRTGTLLHLAAHQSALSAEEKNFLDKVRPILLQADKVPPRTRELVEMTGIPLKPLELILRQTVKEGNLIKVADNRHYLPETIMQLAEFTEKVAQQSTEAGGFSVIQFRDTSGIGRNLCIEILEYFDRVGFTRREGNSRFVRTDKENIFGVRRQTILDKVSSDLRGTLAHPG